MLKSDKDRYDAVIIGAGISGLVCGCYLAKAGMRVLIAEQHSKPGGYCTSFKRKGFTFDAAADCFGAYRKDGITRKILEDLGVDRKLNIIRPNPTDTVITPDHRVSFWSDLGMTIEDFQAAFPEEKRSIKSFFHFLVRPDSTALPRLRTRTFQELLDDYFRNDRLKAILSVPLLAIGGLPPSLMSAFIAAKLFSEFILDGGYYPEGGMQALPDALAERFKEFGGELRLSCPVAKIAVKDASAAGVVLGKGLSIASRYVVSNCDARQTFLKLLDRKTVRDDFRHAIKSMVPTISNFVLYLGLDKHFEPPQNPGTALYFSEHYDLDRAYIAIHRGKMEEYGGYALRISHDQSTVNAIIPAPFKSETYWRTHKESFGSSLLKRIEKFLIPDLSKHVVYQDAATPHTLFRYTLNYRGASYGWAGTPSQLALSDFKKPSFLHGLYLTGHWSTLGVGISGVAYVGYDTAKILLRKEKI
jgi:prolycopene isomerase